MEGPALKLGASVATHGAKTWLQRRREKFVRSASLAELAEAELKSPLQRRRLDNLVERVGHQVTEQLVPVLDARFGSLPDNEIEAAIQAAIDVLDQADLSDGALLAADADAEELARRVRARFDGAERALLAEAAVPLYDLALDLACRHLVQVVRHLPSFQPAALAEILTRLTGQADQLDALLARVPTTSLNAAGGTAGDDEFRIEYLHCLANSLDRLELLGLPAAEQPRLALTVAYLSLSVTDEKARRDRPRWLDERFMVRPAQAVPVEDAIGRASRTLLRGDAGSGKTTLLNWLAVKAARRELTGALAGWNDLVPFPVRLRSFSSGDLPRPEQFVQHAIPVLADRKPALWVHRRLSSGDAMLLVDGVDEVPAGRRRAVRTWLRELLGTYPDIRVVVTARRAAADRRWLADERFTSVDLEPMGQDQVLAFVERWHEAAGDERDMSDALRRLRGQLERPHLRELAATPLLCAMLCALNLSYGSQLPRNRMELYAKALAMLLHLRDAERGIPSMLTDLDKRVVLRDLAWRLTLANRVEFDRADARGHLSRKLPGMPNVDTDPDTLFGHLLERSGVLQEPVPGRVSFVHRTFQEYLAADEAVQQHHVDTLVAHAHLDTWRETVVMACGHATARQASELLAGVLDRADQEPARARALRLVAASCLETVQDIDPAVRTRVDTTVERYLVPPRSLRETASLASVGHRILRHLPTQLDGLSDAKARSCVRVAALTGSPDALPLLARYAKDTRPAVQGEIQEAWQYFDLARFTDVVLADALLSGGYLRVTSRRMLPYVPRLKHVTNLVVYLPAHEVLSDFGLLSEVSNLGFFSAYGLKDRSFDLAFFAKYQGLFGLHLYSADQTVGLAALTGLPALRALSLVQQKPLGELSALAALPTVEDFEFAAKGLRDLDPILAMPALVRVRIREVSGDCLSRTTPSDRIDFVHISHSRNVPFNDVVRTFPAASKMDVLDAAVVGAPGSSSLKSLRFRFSVVDLRSLARLPNLRSLGIHKPVNAPDLTPLADLDIELTLSRGYLYEGIERLGPGVRVSYED